jgi:putative transcriptional regulator
MPSEDSVAPVLLISMPQLADPNFAHAVVLLCDYGAEGAFGLVVNRRMDEPAHEVIRVEPALTIRKDVYLHVGGPVEPTRAWVLTSREGLDEDALALADGVYLSASPVLIRAALEGPPDPEVRIVVGYAGWAPGQLDAELADSAWLTAPVQRDLIFDTPLDQMWMTALGRLGADPASLHGGAGIH